MVAIDTIEGIINGSLWFHYAVNDDVLYLRLVNARDLPTLGEETDDGFILLRTEDTDEPVGLTVVNWWKRFGRGELPDSLRAIEEYIKPWGNKIAA